MVLYLRPRSPYWWYHIVVGTERERKSTKRPHLYPLDPVTGVPKVPHRPTKEQAEAKRAAALVEADILRRRLDEFQLGKRVQMRLGDAVAKYLELPDVKAQRDYRNVCIRARKLIGGEGFEERYRLNPDMKLSEITTGVVETLRAKRRAETFRHPSWKTPRHGSSPATIDREVALLQKIVNTAASKWHAEVRHDTEYPKFKPKGKLRFLTEQEEVALLRELDPTRAIPNNRPYGRRHETLQRKLQDQYDLAVILLDMGPRYNEAASITWPQIDTRHWRTVNIWREKVGNEGVLAMTDRLREVLQRRYRERGRSPYVFPGFTDALQPRGHATKGIMNAMTRAGINVDWKVAQFGKATPHTLRDTFASRLIKGRIVNGVRQRLTLAQIQKLLGHASITTTQKYAHLEDEEVALEAANILDGMKVA